MEKVQRLVLDEPYGVCVGFRLSDEELAEIGGDADDWDLVEDDGGEGSVPVICDADEGNEIRIRPEPSLEEIDAGVLPFGMDSEVWRSRAALAEWLAESCFAEDAEDWIAKNR